MTTDELRERGTQICERLCREVAEIAPEGIGRWNRAWEIAAEPDVEFMLALALWEADPNEDAKVRVRAAYNAVLDAWRRAAADFKSRKQGMP